MFICKYESACDECIGKMDDTVVEFGKATRLRDNAFVREGYTFIGWDAHRQSDNSHCYMNTKTGARRYFKEGKKEKDFVRYYYRNMCPVAKLSRVDNDVIVMRAVWQRDVLRKKADKADENKEIIRNKIESNRIVLIGDAKCIEAFYTKYGSKLNIGKMIVTEEVTDKNSWLNMQMYKKDDVNTDNFYILCAEVKTRGDDVYKKIYTIMKDCNLRLMQNYIRSDIAEAVLDRKKIFLWEGFCQVQQLGMKIFNRVIENAACFFFRYGLDTLPKSYKYEDGLELIKICDYFIYMPVIFAEGKIDYQFEDYLSLDAIKLRIPRIPFMGLYPYKASVFEAFHKYSIDKKLHWPFAYEESIIDEYILAGKDNEYIYSELMRPDLFDKKTIERQLKLAFKGIEIAEGQADIKISDFLKANYQERKCYRDGLHYQNFVYFELARRIADRLGIDCTDKINELEEKYKNIELIDYTEVPVLQCVADTLGLKWVDDNTTYRVKFTEQGEWRGKTSIKLMNRKEWIYLYCDYTRANISLIKIWNL